MTFIKSISTLLLAWLLTGISLQAATIKGRITDKQTGEELVGCAVYISELQLGTTTGFDGTFELRNIPNGSYTLKASFITYENASRLVQLSDKQQEVKVDFVMDATTETLNEVIVVSQIERTSDNSARASERNANQIINVVGAKSIELSPDLNVAAVLQRMSGVTMERNSSGEGQYAILRGMDKRYNYTLVNGVKIPSPDNKHRYVPLDIFPSELLDRVEVTKSLTADMEGDATGGVVNMVMKDAPSRLLVQANAAVGYNSRFVDREMVTFSANHVIEKSPREQLGKDYKATMADFGNHSGELFQQQPLPNGTAGVTIGNRFAHQKLGLILAANYQNFNKNSHSTFFEDEMLQTESQVRLTAQKEREYYENQQQYGVHTKLDVRLSPLHKIEWYNAYIAMTNAQVRQTTSTNFKLNYDPANGDLDLAYQTRIRTQQQSVLASTLHGMHQLGSALSVNWSAVYSTALNRMPENTQINLDNLRQNFVDNIYVDADGSTRRWEHNSDRDYTGYLNLEYKSSIGLTTLTSKAGALYRDKQRSNSSVNYRFKPLSGNPVLSDGFSNLDEIAWTLYTPSGSVGPLEYDADEHIAAGYFRIIVEKSKVNLSVGLRAEHTQQGYFMYFPDAGENPDGSHSYSDWLPSVQIKLASSERVNWKASYFRSVNRAGFFEIVPYQIVNEEYNEYGNKNLQRATIDNVDMRWEYFPKANEQLMVGVFFKKIKNPIEYAYFTTNYRQYGYGPMNLGDARNYGVEIDFIKFLRNWGVKANYTYTHSVITTPKAYYGMDESGSYKRFFKDQSRPLVGQAAHVANLSLMYKNTRHGWDAQLATAYTGEKIDIASHYLDSDYWQAPSFHMDASAEKRLTNGFSIFAKVNNLLASPHREYIKNINAYNAKFPMQNDDPDKTLIRKDEYGQTLLLGVRWKM